MDDVRCILIRMKLSKSINRPYSLIGRDVAVVVR